MITELTKFPIKATAVHPYLKILNKNSNYFIYEGAIGNNRFQFFKVSIDSSAGKLCKEYDEKYNVRNEM